MVSNNPSKIKKEKSNVKIDSTESIDVSVHQAPAHKKKASGKPRSWGLSNTSSQYPASSSRHSPPLITIKTLTHQTLERPGHSKSPDQQGKSTKKQHSRRLSKVTSKIEGSLGKKNRQSGR